MKVATFRDLMNNHFTAEIHCLYTGNLVRRLACHPDGVRIIPTGHDAITVPYDTPITYEPWLMDRGNMNFAGDATADPKFAGKTLKICGEGDPITFQDGTVDYVMPA